MALSYEDIAVSTSAVGLTSSKVQELLQARGLATLNNSVYITVTGGPINVLWTGGAPTSSSGHPYNPYDTIIFVNTDDIQKFQAIRSGSVVAVLRVTYG